MLTHITPTRTLPHHMRKPCRLTSPPHLLSLRPARHVTPLAHCATTVRKSSYHVTPRYTLPRLGESFVSLPTSRSWLILPSRFGMLRDPFAPSCLALSVNPVERRAVFRRAREHGPQGKRSDTHSMFYAPTGRRRTTMTQELALSSPLSSACTWSPLPFLHPPILLLRKTGSGTTRGQAPRFARTMSTR